MPQIITWHLSAQQSRINFKKWFENPHRLHCKPITRLNFSDWAMLAKLQLTNYDHLKGLHNFKLITTATTCRSKMKHKTNLSTKAQSARQDRAPITFHQIRWALLGDISKRNRSPTSRLCFGAIVPCDDGDQSQELPPVSATTYNYECHHAQPLDRLIDLCT